MLDDTREQLIMLNQRFADFQGQQDRFQTQVIQRLDQINGRVGKAHDRASTLEGVISGLKDTVQTMWREWGKIRQRYHDLINREQARLSETPAHGSLISGDPNRQPVSRMDLKEILALIIGTAGITAGVILWVLKTAGKL